MMSDIGLIRIPRTFLVDHHERDLPTPAIVRSTQRHLYILADDPALDDLASDAARYAGGGIDTRAFPELFGLVSSARAILAAIRKSQEIRSRLAVEYIALEEETGHSLSPTRVPLREIVG